VLSLYNKKVEPKGQPFYILKNNKKVEPKGQPFYILKNNKKVDFY